MSYTRHNWVNGSAPALSAENLNQIEDALVQHDTDIAQLKTATNTIPEIRTGSVSLGTCAAGTYTDVPVSFDTAMTGAPKVVVSLVSTSTAAGMGNISLSAINVTNAGFTCRCFNNDASGRIPSISYIAIYGG